MLSKEEFFVLDHYLSQGIPKTTIAKKLGISRMTVYRHAASEKESPAYGPRPLKPLVIDPHRDYIKGRLEIYPELTAARLLAEIKEFGYQGKYTALKDYVRLVRPKALPAFEQRFETVPGQQAQVDFATFKTSFGTVYALLMVLSWSRQLWVRFYFHQDQITVLGGMNRAFRAFGGVPKTVLFDRMKTAVARAAEDGGAIFNDEMLRFATHCGFRPVACRPYRAKTKGKVERAVSYLRHSFFYGRQFRDLEDLNSQLEIWLSGTANTRIHGTTGAIPVERLDMEKSHLLALPDDDYVPVIAVGRRVTRDGYVSYNGNEYSVPDGALKTEIGVMATMEKLSLYQDGKLLASHPLLDGKGQRQLDPSHHHRRPGARWERDFSLDGLDLIEVQRRPLDVYEEVLR